MGSGFLFRPAWCDERLLEVLLSGVRVAGLPLVCRGQSGRKIKGRPEWTAFWQKPVLRERYLS